MNRFHGVVRWGRVVVAVGLFLGACGGGSSHTNDTLPPDTSSTTTTTTVSYDVPATIDAAYVTKVMQALDHVYGDAIRALKKSGKPDADFQARMAAIYDQHYYELTLELWGKGVAAGLTDIADPPGDPKTTVTKLIQGDSQCVVAAVDRDYQPLHNVPSRSQTGHFIALVPAPASRRLAFNPTPWMLRYDGFRSDGSVPPSPCAAS